MKLVSVFRINHLFLHPKVVWNSEEVRIVTHTRHTRKLLGRYYTIVLK